MLVINGIELDFFNEIDGVRKFQNNAPAGFQERAQARDKIVRVWRMSKDIVAKNNIRFAAGSRQVQRKIVSKKFDYCFNPFFSSDFGNICRGFDAEARDLGGLEILEEITVIARNLNNQAFMVERKIIDISLSGLFCVPQHHVGKRREVEVLRK